MNNRIDWTFRIIQEAKKHIYSSFLTLTYTEENLPIGGTLVKEHCKLFLKKLRKKLGAKSVRYYLVGEYGTETARAHYHMIAFGIPPNLNLDPIWGHGHVDRREVEIGAIHYVTKYHVNRYGEHGGREPPFALMSRRPGIGYNYLATHTQWHRADFRNYAKINGIISRLPRYFKEKIFSERERKALSEISILASDVSLYDVYDKLRQHHPDPYAYYEEMLQAEHDKVIHKCNTKNLF